MTDKNNQVFIAKLPYGVNEDKIETIFSEYGKIKNINLKKGFGFISYESQKDAEDAIKNLNKTSLEGNIIVVEKILDKRDNELNKNFKRYEKICFNCDKKGHLAKHCRNKKNSREVSFERRNKDDDYNYRKRSNYKRRDYKENNYDREKYYKRSDSYNKRKRYNRRRMSSSSIESDKENYYKNKNKYRKFDNDKYKKEKIEKDEIKEKKSENNKSKEKYNEKDNRKNSLPKKNLNDKKRKESISKSSLSSNSSKSSN